MKLAIVLVVLVVGTLIFHFASPWWFTPLASNWSSIDFTIDVTFWVTGFVFVGINLFLAFIIFKYRYSSQRKSDYEPENKKLELGLTLFTTAGVALMLAPGLFVWAKIIDVPHGADEVEVVAQQWHWSFRFPGEDGVFGKSHTRFISAKNPLGLDPGDAAASDDIVVMQNELHLPVDRPVKILLRSKDVLHNFAVPQFRVKMDAVPGLVSYVWFTPKKNGRYDILCMELCGVAHYAMRGSVVVESNNEFSLWLDAQPTFIQTQEILAGDVQQGKSFYAICASCHGENAQGMEAMSAPVLAGQDKSYLIRQLKHYRTSVRGAHPDDTLGQQMIAMSATLPSDSAVHHVAAYIASLPLPDMDVTFPNVDLQQGEKIYQSCARCHGASGQGNPLLSAPRLAGLQDWYVKRQLLHFKQGIRGKHLDDHFGRQMQLMAITLTNEKALDNVAAYIAQLKDKDE